MHALLVLSICGPDGIASLEGLIFLHGEGLNTDGEVDSPHGDENDQKDE